MFILSSMFNCCIKKQTKLKWMHFLFILFAAEASSDSVIPETEKLSLEGRIVQKLECRPYGKDELLFIIWYTTGFIYSES